MIEDELDTCIFCGTNEDVHWTIDPYAWELYGDEDTYPICNVCYQHRKDDI